MSLTVDIWSDVACPWCYIGKKRFEAGLAQFAHRDQVEVTWHSFELDPGMPMEISGSLVERLAKKFGTSQAQVLAMNAQITGLAAQEGIQFQLDRVKPTNTFLAHQLIHFAAEHDQQDAMKERLLQAYFSDGLKVSDLETLGNLASELGLDANAARAALSQAQFAEAVRADERHAAELGISGVPFFVFDGRYGVSGAQAAETFLDVLNQVWEREHAVVAVAADGPSCDDETCAI